MQTQNENKTVKTIESRYLFELMQAICSGGDLNSVVDNKLYFEIRNLLFSIQDYGVLNNFCTQEEHEKIKESLNNFFPPLRGN